MLVEACQIAGVANPTVSFPTYIQVAHVVSRCATDIASFKALFNAMPAAARFVLHWTPSTSNVE